MVIAETHYSKINGQKDNEQQDIYLVSKDRLTRYLLVKKGK